MRISLSMIDADWRGIYKVGGIFLAIAGSFWLSASSLFATGSLFYLDGEEALKGLAAVKSLFQIQMALFGGGAVAALFGFPALYVVLREVRKPHALLSSLLLGATGLLVIVQTVTYSALGPLSSGYAAAAGEAQQAAYVVTADVVLQHTYTHEMVVSLVFGSAVLIASLAMLKGGFNKAVAYLGLIAGVLDLARYAVPLAVPGFPSHENVAGHLLAFVWLILTGARFMRMGYVEKFGVPHRGSDL